MPDSASKQGYYGWKVVGAILFILTFTSGLSFYNHAIYLNVLAARPAFSVQTTSIAISIFFLSGGVAGLWVAKFVQDYDPRYCICVGAVISFVSLSSLGYVDAVWQLYLSYAFFGVGFAASALIPATTLVTRWFHKKRAMALSIASTGLSLGGVILTPLSALLVENVSFTTAAPILGLVYLLGVIPVSWIWLRPSPESMGLNADGVIVEQGDEAATVEAATVDVAASSAKNDELLSSGGISFKQARQGRFFWGISLAYIFLMMAQVGGIAHQYGLARELLTDSQTALAVAILPVASIFGRLIGGWLIGQMSIRLFAMAMMVLQASSLLVLAGGYSVLSLCIGLAMFGATVGNLLMLQPLLIADAFGIRDYAKIFSVASLMSSWGTAAGPALLGYIYTSNQDHYQLAYSIAAMAGVLGLLLFVSAGSLKK